MIPIEFLKNRNINTKLPGIYMILCIPTGKAYIGSSKNMYRRWSQHKNKLKNNKHPNNYLQNIYNKYGKDCLIFYGLENCENLIEREVNYLTKLDKCFRINIAAITKNVPASLELRKKLSLINKNTIPPSRKGAVLSEETKQLISLKLKGRKQSKITTMKIKETKQSKEYKEKMKIIYKKVSLSRKKLNVEQVKEIKERFKNGEIPFTLFKEGKYPVSKTTLYNIYNNQRYLN